jgi:hypothetical protein
MNGEPVKFEQLLPQLVSSYRRGELVPFIGAGMRGYPGRNQGN